jgi:signal transduction histidine kinase
MYLKILIALLAVSPLGLQAQTNPLYVVPTKQQADSLKVQLQQTTNDTIRMEIVRALAGYYYWLKADSSIYYEERALELANNLGQKLWAADITDLLGASYSNSGEFNKGLKMHLAAEKIAKDPESELNIWNLAHFTHDNKPVTARLNVLAGIYLDKSNLYRSMKNQEEELKSRLLSKEIAELNKDSATLSLIFLITGEDQLTKGNLDSAEFYIQKSQLCVKASNYTYLQSALLNSMGMIYLKKGDFLKAKENILAGLSNGEHQSNLEYDVGNSYSLLSDYFGARGETDSALFFSRKALHKYQSIGFPRGTLVTYQSLASLYHAKKKPDSAYYYMNLAFNLNDSLNNSEKIKQFQNIGFNELLRVAQLENDKAELQNKIRMYFLVGGLGVFVILSIMLYRNNRNRMKANEQLQKQKAEIESQKKTVEHTLDKLKSTQAQLIQSEKMASLGELTAGIAHEIQNPLNFVNNFSDLNQELIEELEEVLNKRDVKEASVIVESLKGNESKINLHGRRADSIVKSMLQHGRASSGQKEPTDINKLVDEYTRLAYHGFRARNKEFNVKLVIDLDPNLPLVPVVAQDIGRVILNLLNNSFQAVEEKARTAGEGYQPTVTVSTRRSPQGIDIKVEDNGPGIPDNIKDKIFQPFFTTKPTGQGTGLGLSLSYDIVKAHGGGILLGTAPGGGTSFTVKLPANAIPLN